MRDPKKVLMLGTCMWGWNVNRSICHKLLDLFYESGHREIDTAANYPMTDNNEDFHLADRILGEWIKVNDVHDLEINAKVGSINNNGSPENNLSYSYLHMMNEYYLGIFGSNLKTIMVHWDNRENIEEIEDTIEYFRQAIENDITIGLSGIKYPKSYSGLLNGIVGIPIQVKRHLLQDSIDHYITYFPNSRYYLYGINLSGIKSDSMYNDQNTFNLREMGKRIDFTEGELLSNLLNSAKKISNHTIKSLFHINFTYAFNCVRSHGIIIGPSNPVQLDDTIDLFNYLNSDASSGIKESINLTIRNLNM